MYVFHKPLKLLKIGIQIYRILYTEQCKQKFTVKRTKFKIIFLKLGLFTKILKKIYKSYSKMEKKMKKK